MPFQLLSETQDQVVLRQTRFYKRFAIGFAVLAFVFLLIGITGLLLYNGNDPMIRPFFMVFTGVAAVLLAVGWIIPLLRRRFDPYQVIFDNGKGRVEIIQDKEGNQKAFIPYDEISRFDIRVKSETGTNSGTRAYSRRYYRYFVHFLKKDGGAWDLFESTSEAAAIALLERMKQTVRLQASPVPAGKTALSPKLEQEQLAGMTTIRWKNPTLAGFLLFIPVVAMIGAVLWFFWFRLNMDDLFFRIVLGFMALIFVLVIVANGIKLVKDSFRTYGIRIDGSTLEYFEASKKGEIKKSKAYPLKEIAAVVFHFKEREFESDIYILRAEEAELHRKIAEGEIGFGDLGRLFGSTMNELRLRLTQLNCTERLQVENWLQEEIGKRSGKAGG